MTIALRARRETTQATSSALPEWPLGWYVVARSEDLPRKSMREVNVAGQAIVLFRTALGALAAMDAFCPHMGAHLRHAQVRGEALECPLHRLRFSVDGTVAPAGSCKRARTHQVEEKFGLVFLHFGEAAGPLPGPRGDEALVWTTGTPVSIDASWHAMAVNGFDMPHLSAVHHRELVEPAQITIHGRERLELRYTSRVTGHSVSDRVMKWLSRDRIQVTQHCFGSVIVVETELGFTRTAAVLGLFPQERGVRAFGAFGIRKGPFAWLKLLLTRWLFTAFLRRDFRVVTGMRLSTDVADPGVRALASFLRSLPRAQP